MTLSGSHAEYALARPGALAERPAGLDLDVAAGAPVVACAAIQMLYDIAQVGPGQTVLVHGGAGAVGSCAVQIAARRGARVAATASGRDRDHVHALGAETVVDYRGERFEDGVRSVDAVIDTVGGETLSRSIGVVRPGGVIVTSPKPPSALQLDEAEALGVRLEFLEVDVTTRRLRDVGDLLTAGTLTLAIATTAPLSESRRAQELLESPHRGKIVLVTDQA
jgi:NADPH:quinone reductase-like Zn-dependent oxidoreductase